MSDLQLPQAIDVEKCLLGCMMLSTAVIGNCVEVLDEEALHHPAHRIIWGRLLAMWKAGKAIDLITVTDALESAGELQEVGGPAEVTAIFNSSPTASNWKEYARILRAKWMARQAIKVADGIRAAAFNPAEEAGIAQLAQDGLVKIAGFTESRAETKHIRDVVLRRLDYYENVSKRKGRLEGISTGIRPLDIATRGLRPGNMIVIAAETKGGKTALAMNIAMNAAFDGYAVGIFSLEMNEGELADRMIAARAGVNMSQLGDEGFAKRDLDRAVRTASEISLTQIFIRDESVLNPLQFRAGARKLVAQHKCRLIIVDYLQLMQPTNSRDQREQQVAECSRTIKTTASELGIPIIVLSQLNENGRSRESRAIEQDCNIFAVIEQDDDGHWINLKYTRDCQGGRIPVTFRKEHVRFTERES